MVDPEETTVAQTHEPLMTGLDSSSMARHRDCRRSLMATNNSSRCQISPGRLGGCGSRRA